MNKLWGGVMAVTAFIACPCHLPLTLPLLLGALGGGGIGGLIASNTGLVYGLATAYFVFGLGAGVFLLNRKRRGTACEVPGARRTRSDSRKPQARQRGITAVGGKGGTP